MYMPAIIDAHHVESYVMGPLLTMVFTDCKSEGPVKYTHVLFVYIFDPEADEKTGMQRLMAVAAEVNQSPFANTTGSHFLGVFPGSGHINMGSSDSWADLEKFTEKALEVVAEKFNIAQAPRLIPRQDTH